MKEAFHYPWIFLSLCCAIVSCKTQQQKQVMTEDKNELKEFVLKYDRSPCFGQCPVYTFYLLNDHTALVYSKANLMDTSGWYFAKPDQESIVEILELIEPQEWWLQDLRDQPEIADLPAVSLVYHHHAGLRNLSIQSRTSHEFENVFGKLNHLVTESRWKPTVLRPDEISQQEMTNVIVQLKDGVDIRQWMKKFDEYGMHLIKRLSPNQQYYLVAKDPAKGFANDFLQLIKRDPEVIDAQWDRKLEERR